MSPVRFGAKQYYAAWTYHGLLKKLKANDAFAVPNVEELTLHAEKRGLIGAQAVRLTGVDASVFLNENYGLDIAPGTKASFATLNTFEEKPRLYSEDTDTVQTIYLNALLRAVMDDAKPLGASLFARMVKYFNGQY
jgi:hypothetical protein